MLARISRNAHHAKNKEARIQSKAFYPCHYQRMTIGVRRMVNCEAAQIAGLFGRWLSNQRHHHRDRQQTHGRQQKVVAPAGNQSKHVQSPGNKSQNTATWERLQFRRINMDAIRYSSTSVAVTECDQIAIFARNMPPFCLR